MFEVSTQTNDMRISDSLEPPGGWKYQQGEYWIFGGTSAELIAALTAHRKENGYEIGDPWKDIMDQIATRFPDFRIA